jgi:hydrogenase maturation protease
MKEHTVLVAGLGNIFLGDDGFGVEVIKRLAAFALPERVRVAAFGIRGMSLLSDIIDQDYDTIILVDTAARGGVPGTLYLIEACVGETCETELGAPDAHAMTPDMVLKFLRDFDGASDHVLIVGCEPALLEEDIGLSAPVRQAVEEATRLILDLVWRTSRVSASVA